MKPFLYSLLLLPCAFLLTGCLEESINEGPRAQDGFSNPLSLNFSDDEMEVLNQDLSLDQQIDINSVNVPRHLTDGPAFTSITPTSSDARKALLGRVLFYDTRLSATGETSCNTCHLQEAAFSDTKAFSDGINGAVTKRNSIALGSVPTFAPEVSGYGSSGDETSAAVEGRVRFFWDERAGTVKEQSEATIQDEIEMGKDLNELADELRELEMYRILSMKAFGTTELTPDRITLALEKFTSSISSMNTRFDALADAERFNFPMEDVDVTSSELMGRQLFLQNCASCHSTSLGEPSVTVASNGLDDFYTDNGVGDVTGAQWQNGVFKVPFLRNVALTGPYMHDGRFETLREVIDHYSEGIAAHPNLHENLRNNNGQPKQMNFSEIQKRALIDFLEMTTDETVTTAPEFSDPFQR